MSKDNGSRADDLLSDLASKFLIRPYGDGPTPPLNLTAKPVVMMHARDEATKPAPPPSQVLSLVEAAQQVLFAIGHLAPTDNGPTERYATIIQQIYFRASRIDGINLEWPDDDTMRRRTAMRHLEIVRQALLQYMRERKISRGAKSASHAELLPPTLPEGHYLMPPQSLTVLAERVGLNPDKARTLLKPYDLRNYPPDNRQSWTVRLDTMPPTLRGELDTKSKAK